MERGSFGGWLGGVTLKLLISFIGTQDGDGSTVNLLRE